MAVASETISPLKPSRWRSRVMFRCPLSDAGRNASTPASGSSERTKAGNAMWADMTLSTPAAIARGRGGRRSPPSRRDRGGLMVVTRCWSRSSKPSPGQCLTRAATPCAWNTSICFRACRSMVATSLPKPRVATMALRKAALMSMTGVNDQLIPTATASSAMMRLISAVASRSSTAARASGFGTPRRTAGSSGCLRGRRRSSGGTAEAARSDRDVLDLGLRIERRTRP